MEQLYPRETSQITPSPGRVPQLSGRASAAISHNNTRKIHRLCIGWWVTVSVCSSWFQDCAPIPVGGVSRVPDGEWPQHRQLTAILHNIADFGYPEAVAELCKDVLVLGVDEPSCPNLKGDVETLEAVSLDGGGELPVPLGLPWCRRFLAEYWQ